MIVTDYETFEVPPRSLLLKIETDGGIVGWGEPVVEGRAQPAASAVRKLMDRYIVGSDPRDIELLWQQMYRSGFYRGGPILMSALSGIDQALWDIKGKWLDVPIYELLGGKARERIQLYAHVSGSTPDDIAASVSERISQGFTAVKGGPGVDFERFDTPSALSQAEEHVNAMREAAGDDVSIMLDFHGKPSKSMAKRIVKTLEPYDPMFYEELVVPEKNHALSEIGSHTTIPIATGERMFSRWDFRDLLNRGVVDVLQPDVAHAGGITELRKIASMAEAYGVAIAPHAPLSSISLAASIQVDACTHNAIIQEQIVLNDEVPNYLTDMSIFDIDEKGYIDLPDGPGLGIQVDEAYVREMATEDAWDAPLMRYNDGAIAEW